MRFTIVRDLLAQPDPARYGPLKRYGGLLLSSCFLILFMALCTPPISQASADMLSLDLRIQDQYSTAPRVSITLFVSLGGAFGLGPNLSLACDGTVFPHLGYNATISLPRRPAGEAYDCVYSDGQGHKTPLTIPIPPGTLAFTSPAAGATVPIPGSASSTAGPLPRPPDQTGTLTIQYTLPTPPPDAMTVVWAQATCTGGSGSPCNARVEGAGTSATGTCLITDANVAYGLGFEAFASGASGEIQLTSSMSWTQPPNGFHSVHLTYFDTLSIPVTWSRAES